MSELDDLVYWTASAIEAVDPRSVEHTPTAYLVRHGAAEEVGESLMDDEKQLTSHGKQQMEAVAQLINRFGARIPNSVVIYASPAEHTKEAAKQIQASLDYEVQLELRNRLSHDETLMCVVDLLGEVRGRDQLTIIVTHEAYLNMAAEVLELNDSEGRTISFEPGDFVVVYDPQD